MSANIWSHVDAWAKKSEAEFKETEAKIKACKGWRFGGCPDGLMWTARHSKHGVVKRRHSYDLVKEVQELNDEDERAASGPTATSGK